MTSRARTIAVPVVLLSAVLLATTACVGDGASSQSAPQLPSTSPTTSAAADDAIKTNPETNERGYIVKELGEQAGMGDAGEQPAVTFSIDKIVVDPPCWEHGRKPESGHTLLVHMRIATDSGPRVADTASSLTMPFAYTEVGSNGITHQARSGSCTDYKQHLRPMSFGINQKYRGTVELVVPEASGTLVLAPPTLKRGGWEWRY